MHKRYFLPVLMILLFLLAARPITAQETQTETTEQREIAERAILAAARNAIKMQQLERAKLYFSRHLENRPDDVGVMLEYAGLLAQTGDTADALDVLNRLLTSDPNNTQALKLKVNLLGTLGRTDEAMNLVQLLRRSFPEDDNLRRLEADLLAGRGEQVRPAEMYGDLLKAQTSFDKEDIFINYANIMLNGHQWQQVVDAYETNQQTLQLTDRMRTVLIPAYVGTGNMEEALRLYRQMPPDSNQTRMAALRLADAFIQQGRTDAAVGLLYDMIEDHQPTEGIVVKLALILMDLGRIREADDLLQKYRHVISPSLQDLTRAKLLTFVGQHQAAYQLLETLQAQPAIRNEAALLRAGILYDTQRDQEALFALAGILNGGMALTAHERAQAYCLMALASIRTGDFNLASDAIHQLHKASPGDASPNVLQVLRTLAMRDTQTYENAVAELGLKLKEFRSAATWIRPALINQVPLESWRAANRLNPNNTPLAIQLARAESENGNVFQAEKNYRALAYSGDADQARMGLARCDLLQQKPRDAASALDAVRPDDLTPHGKMNFIELRIQTDDLLQAQRLLETLSPPWAASTRAEALQMNLLAHSSRPGEAGIFMAHYDFSRPLDAGIAMRVLSDVAAMNTRRNAPGYTFVQPILHDMALSALSSGNRDMAYAAAQVFLNHGDVQPAADVFSRIYSQNPADMLALKGLIFSYVRMRDYNQASELCARYIHQVPADADMQHIFARLSVWQKRFIEADRRYRQLMAIYPRSDWALYEWQAKRNAWLERTVKAIPWYSQYNRLDSSDREMIVEEANQLFYAGHYQKAIQHYEKAALRWPDDPTITTAANQAARMKNWSAGARFNWIMRDGRSYDYDQDQLRGDAFIGLPQPFGGFAMDIGAGLSRFAFTSNSNVNAQHVFAQASQRLLNGITLDANAEISTYDTVDQTTLQGDLNASWLLDYGLRPSLFAGREDMLDNYNTMDQGLGRYLAGAGLRWQPLSRFTAEAYARYYFIDESQTVTGTQTNLVDRRPVVEDVVQKRDNRAYEAFLATEYKTLLFPYMLSFWLNGYYYDVHEQNDAYWTPEDAYISGTAGITWRHHLLEQSSPGMPVLYYELRGSITADSESDTLPGAAAFLFWDTGSGWELGLGGRGNWGTKYKQEDVTVNARYRF
jgi:tetratricopeptide (TPR) repeat protein